MNETDENLIRVSILVERWDYIGDKHSSKGWKTEDIIRLTMLPPEEALNYIRKLQFEIDRV